MKKKIAVILVAAAACVLAGVLFTACGNSNTMFGNTYVYDGVYAGYTDEIGTLNMGSKEKGKIIEENLDKIDWAKTMKDETFGETVTTFDRAKELLLNAAGDKVDKAYNGCTVTFGSGRGKKIKFANKEYLAYTDPEMSDGYVDVYDITDVKFEKSDLGSFWYIGSDNSRIALYGHTDLSGKTDVEPYSDVTVVFTEPVSYPGGTTSAIRITFYASFKLQK